MELGLEGITQCDAFTRAFDRQNQHFETAIRSLDTLNEQIVQFIINTYPDADLDSADPYSVTKWSQRCHYSVVLMRRLLSDVQAKFRKMIEDNKALASRIDQDIQNAHLQVSQLRAELADTNQRLNDIYVTSPVPPSMAGNVITTCMPPTSTTTTSTVTEGQWQTNNASGLLVDSGPKKRDVKPPPQPLAVEGKLQGRTSTLVSGLHAKNHSDPGLRPNRPEPLPRSSTQSHPCSRKNSKEKSNAPSRFSALASARADGGRSSPSRDSARSFNGPSTSTATGQQVVYKSKTKIPNGEESVKPSMVDGAAASANTSPAKMLTNSKSSTSTASSSRDDTSVPHDRNRVQQKGPVRPVAQTSSKQYSPGGSQTVAATNGSNSTTDCGLNGERASTSREFSTVVITKEFQAHHQQQQNSDKRSATESTKDDDELLLLKTRESNWISEAFDAVAAAAVSASSDVHAALATKCCDKRSIGGKDYSDKESRPYYNSWCSDTGDSVSDNLTSDECMRDHDLLPEAERLAAVPKGFESEGSSTSRNCGYRKTTGPHYSSYKGVQEIGDVGQHRGVIDTDVDSLRIKCSALQRDLEEVMESRDEKAKENAAMSAKLEKLENELKHAKESLTPLKQDRKRLKAEKFDLLAQMKQLYSTLEDKEAELREFIRNYEQKMKDSDEAIKQLRKDREELEKEKRSLLHRAREEAERCVHFCNQSTLKDAHIKELQEELAILREKHLSMEQDLRQTPSAYGSPGSVSYRTANGIESSRGSPTPTPGSDPTTSSSYGGTPTIAMQYSGMKDSGKASSSPEDHRPSLLSRSAEDIFNSAVCVVDEERQKVATISKKGKEKKGSTWGSISRVFSRNKQRRKALDPDLFQNSRTSWSPKSSVCSSSPLSEESYHQKLRLLEETHGTPMEHWRAATVLAWLEITMDMPQYGTMCGENIKSGKVLLELSDAELEEGLGISNVMHRRKLRLAIEEHREPSLCRYPKICLMTHSWVVEEWLPSIALTSYLPIFSEHLVDGRVLDTLTKKDLEKHFGITRKFHQMSIIHGIHLLRILNFDRQVLNQRRMNSESMDVDPLVWTNQRFIKWAASIDLGEYAENLRNSGVHGALAVLENTFSAETMATALGIPTSKNIIRRHLTTEWQNLIQPARLSLESESLVAKKSKSEKRLVSGSSSTSLASQGGKNSNGLVQSYARRTLDRYDRRRTSWRFSTWRSSQESLKSTCSKKAAAASASSVHQTPIVERPRLLPLSPKLNSSSRHRRTFSSHSDVETLTVTPV